MGRRCGSNLITFFVAVVFLALSVLGLVAFLAPALMAGVFLEVGFLAADFLAGVFLGLASALGCNESHHDCTECCKKA